MVKISVVVVVVSSSRSCCRKMRRMRSSNGCHIIIIIIIIIYYYYYYLLLLSGEEEKGKSSYLSTDGAEAFRALITHWYYDNYNFKINKGNTSLPSHAIVRLAGFANEVVRSILNSRLALLFFVYARRTESE